MGKVGEAIKSGFESFGSAVKHGFEAVGDVFKGDLKKAGEDAGAAVKDVGGIVKSVVSVPVSLAEDVTGHKLDKVLDPILNVQDKIIGGVASVAANGCETVGKVSSDVVHLDLKAAVGDTVAGATSAVGIAVKTVTGKGEATAPAAPAASKPVQVQQAIEADPQLAQDATIRRQAAAIIHGAQQPLPPYLAGSAGPTTLSELFPALGVRQASTTRVFPDAPGRESTIGGSGFAGGPESLLGGSGDLRI